MSAAAEPDGSTRSAATGNPPESASPALAAGLAVTVTQIYTAGEAAILSAITLNARLALRSLDPATELARRAPIVQNAVRRIMDRAEHQAARAVPKALSEAYRRGHGIERLAAEHAVLDILGRLRTLRYGVVRWAWQLLGRLAAAMRTPNPLPIADHVLQQAAGRGIVAGVDSRGREQALRSTVEQTVQHQAGQASIEGFTDRLADEGDDLVIVTESPHPCPLCDPWEHKVLSVSGASAKHPSMATAREAGLFHPNCHHTIFRWFPGFEWPPHSLSNQPGTYEATQRQRNIERAIRSWKRRAEAALDPLTEAKAKAKVREWQGKLRVHVRTENLKRSRQREQTDYGHTPSIKHAHG